MIHMTVPGPRDRERETNVGNRSFLHSAHGGMITQSQKRSVPSFPHVGELARIQDEPSGEECVCSGFDCGVDSLSIWLPVAGPEATIEVSVLADTVPSIAPSGTTLSSSRAKSSAFPRSAALDAARSVRCLVRNVVTLALAMLITTLAESMSIAVLLDGKYDDMASCAALRTIGRIYCEPKDQTRPKTPVGVSGAGK
jgi:hypothetical protein